MLAYTFFFLLSPRPGVWVLGVFIVLYVIHSIIALDLIPLLSSVSSFVILHPFTSAG